MFYQNLFEEQAQQAAARHVIKCFDARLKMENEYLERSGLLCAVEGALVFVKEEMLKPGETIVFERDKVSKIEAEKKLLGFELTLATEQGRYVFSGLASQAVDDLLSAAGLSATSAMEPYMAKEEPSPLLGATDSEASNTPRENGLVELSSMQAEPVLAASACPLLPRPSIPSQPQPRRSAAVPRHTPRSESTPPVMPAARRCRSTAPAEPLPVSAGPM